MCPWAFEPAGAKRDVIGDDIIDEAFSMMYLVTGYGAQKLESMEFVRMFEVVFEGRSRE